MYLRVAIFPLLAFASCTSNTPREGSSNPEITYKINGDSITGFSYQIFLSGKLFINQVEIPAVGGFQKFRQKEQAEKVAKLVVKKISSSSQLPSVTKVELDSLVYNQWIWLFRHR